MFGWLRAYLKSKLAWRHVHRKHRKRYHQWLAAHPGGSYGQFYGEETRRRIDAGDHHKTLGHATIDQAEVKARAQRVLRDFKQAGCAPHHVFVDYGCGSLWIGEAFMGYLDPGKYVGLDVSDIFFAEGLARIPAELLANRRPIVRAISEEALRDVRALKPDFILSIAVMHHVPPEDLAGFLGRIVSLAGLDTRIEIYSPFASRTKYGTPRTWHHGRGAIESALAPLGYKAEFRPEYRIMPTTQGFSVLRR